MSSCRATISNLLRATGTCLALGTPYTTDWFPRSAWYAWAVEGKMIQNALPLLSADDREFMITGLSPDAFASIAEEDDYDDPL